MVVWLVLMLSQKLLLKHHHMSVDAANCRVHLLAFQVCLTFPFLRKVMLQCPMPEGHIYLAHMNISQAMSTCLRAPCSRNKD